MFHHLAGRLHSSVKLIALCCALSTAGCASNKLPPLPSTTSQTQQVYRIGALDQLSVVVWRNPDLTATVQVRPDGRISLPLVENLPAAGRMPDELSRDIELALAKYIREPVVTVIVNNFQGVITEQIRIVGEAARPQSVPYRQGMTLLDVMIQVGGLTEFASGNDAVLVRTSEPGKQYSIRLKDLVKGGDISANAEIRPGDIIIIPQGWF